MSVSVCIYMYACSKRIYLQVSERVCASAFLWGGIYKFVCVIIFIDLCKNVYQYVCISD